MFTIKQLYPSVFLLEFENGYDLGMTFCRYQEYYESPNPRFRKNSFTLIDFMEWYAKENGSWSYPEDWAGFNLPSYVINHMVLGHKIADWNKYDAEMWGAYMKMKNMANSAEFYIIGAMAGEEETVNHELAHSFYAQYPGYKWDMDLALDFLSTEEGEWIDKQLANDGYHPEVFYDETQAYLATDPTTVFIHDMKARFGKRRVNKIIKKFSGIYNAFKENAVIV